MVFLQVSVTSIGTHVRGDSSSHLCFPVFHVMWAHTEQHISCGHNIFISLLFVEKFFALCNTGELYCDATNVVLHYKYPKQWQWLSLRLVRLLYFVFVFLFPVCLQVKVNCTCVKQDFSGCIYLREDLIFGWRPITLYRNWNDKILWWYQGHKSS